MDKKNELTQEELALIKGDSVLNSLSTFIEQGTDVALSAFNSEVVATTWETIRVISENLVEASKVITVFRKVASIPDKLFLNKMEKYCEGLFEIPLDKRNKYVKKVGKARLNEDSAFILGILNETKLGY